MVPLERMTNVLLALFVLSGSIFGSYLYWSAYYQPPIKYLSITVLNKDMKPGEALHGRVTFDRRRNCPAVSYRSITKIRSDGSEEIIHRDIVNQVASKIGESINLRFDMPLPNIETGSYLIRIVGRHDCDGHIFTIELPTAGFNVVE